MNTTESIRELFLLLESMAIEILQLNFEEDAASAKLEELQSVQLVTRQRIDDIAKSNSDVDMGAVKDLIVQCYSLEQQITIKLSDYSDVLNGHIHKFKTAEIARNKYQAGYTYAEGFFLDEHQ
ncbi:hypothetical protein FHS14_002090 [Paenibacillus baekrokdamisoli]|nr:hypothetical protein [Paenibacillus baekrokdamisoli]MBB3069103.1 hypothetical protein [Paenibacillus baekrokdamisoli]